MRKYFASTAAAAGAADAADAAAAAAAAAAVAAAAAAADQYSQCGTKCFKVEKRKVKWWRVGREIFFCCPWQCDSVC